MTETSDLDPPFDDEDDLDEEMEIGDPAEARINVIVYMLYLLSASTAVTGIIGVVLAYINRDENDLEWVDTHFSWQIQTFWKGLLLGVIGTILTPVLIGIPILIFVFVWWVLRAARGMLWVIDGQSVPNPDSWMFGTEVDEGPINRDEIVP